MAIDNKVSALRDLINLKSGYPFRGSEWVESGTPVIKIKNVQDGFVDLNGCSYVNSETASRAAGWYGEVGNTLIALTGAGVGEIGRIREGQSGLINQRVGWVKAHDPEEEDYVFYLLRFLKKSIIDLAGGSAQPNVSPLEILEIACQVPSRGERVAIGKYLSSFDEKILANSAIAETLEKISLTIFKSWFIDFDPVRAKMAGQKPFGMDSSIADLFPDSIMESELGLIPKDWGVYSINRLLTLNKKTIKPSNETSAVPYVPIDQISSKSIFLNKSLTGELAQTSLVRFQKMDILFGAMRPYFHKVALAPFSGTTRTTTFVLRTKISESLCFALFTIFQDRAIEYATSHSQGTTIPYATWSNSFENFPYVQPPLSLVSKFNDLVLPLLEYGQSLIKENEYLSSIRDSLIPRLISGELQIPDEMLES